MPFRNPVVPGFYPDPSICRVGEDYYLVTSSFEYFPGVPVFHSRDLVSWRQIGHCLTRPEQLPLERARSSGGIYAPTIRYHDGHFYMVTTNVTGGGHFYVTTTDPAGEWSDPVWVDAIGGIDPSLLFDADGRVYFTCKHELAIWQFEINIATGRALTEPRRIWGGTGGQHPEAPHLYNIDGRYYLVIAEGGTGMGHMVTCARADSPDGPFEPCPHNPILTHRSTNHPIQATGHADLVEAPDGSWWLVCLGIRPKGTAWPPVHHLGRETFLTPVTWSQDGWPIPGEEGFVALESPLTPPGAAPDVAPAFDGEVHDDFVMPRLNPEWNFLRNPHAADWSVGETPGWLRLTGSAVTLEDVDSPAWVGRRQQHFEFRAGTALRFDPIRDGEEAGLTVFMNERHHYVIALTRRDGARIALVRAVIGGIATELWQGPVGEGTIALAIAGDAHLYRFRWAASGETPATVATAPTRHLSTEVAGGFTGVYLAMYATGNGQPGATPAYFDHFTYSPFAE